jgi:hypothetical protein
VLPRGQIPQMVMGVDHHRHATRLPASIPDVPCDTPAIRW